MELIPLASTNRGYQKRAGGVRMTAKITAMGLTIALAATAASAQVDLAAAFGARETIADISISPDGTKLAYIVPTTGQGSALITVGTGKDAKASIALTMNGDPSRLKDCHWVSNERLVCTIWGVVREPDFILPFSRVIAADANGGNPRMLSKAINDYSRGYYLRGGEVIDWLPDEDGIVLMTRSQLPDDRAGTRLGTSREGLLVERIDTRTLAASTAEPVRPNINSYISDRHGTVRIMMVSQRHDQSDTGVLRSYYRAVGSRDWKPLGDYNYVTDTGFEPQAIDYERNAVFGFRKADGRQAVYRMALDGSMKEEPVFARPDVDIDELIYIGRRHRVVGATYVTDIRQQIYFDPVIAKLSASLAKALPKAPKVRIVDSSSDESKLLIWAGSDDDPGVYYVLDRATHELAIFQPVRPQLEGMTLAKVEAVNYPAADGTLVPAYLTLPVGSAGKKLPAIVLPHGGPSARDEWGFDWLSQYYAARGFAVLQPNFRESSGYGDAWFQQNGFRSWRIAVGDIADAGRWLVARGIADPNRLAIVGWSYGGYAALQSGVIDPGLFKAIVAIAPVTDLAALKEQSRDWSNYDLVRDFIGAGPHIKEGSPAQNAGRIKAPVLLVHGTLDRNVDISQSKLMDDRLRDAAVPHQLMIFDKLDHYLDDSAARAKLLGTSDAFLRKAMGM